MNTYNYKCADCEEVFNIEADIQERETGTSDKFKCPKCQSKNIKEKFSAGNFIKNLFAGSDNKDESCCGESDCCGDSPKKPEENDCCSDDKDKGCCGDSPKKPEENDCCSDDKDKGCCG